jgi:DNA replicative helicase MCM subunit Mcm2 (Cdc46/Mcm family)
MSRLGPSGEAFDTWTQYFSEHLGAKISTLVNENIETEDCLPLHLSLSKMRQINPILYDKITIDPISELENGEFVLQKMVEDQGGMFEINLRFEGLPPENYKDPVKMGAKEFGTLLWFDAVPVWVEQLSPWFKKGAWKCERCSRITLIENKRGEWGSMDSPEICDRKVGGCGRMTKDNRRSEEKKSRDLTKFTIAPHYGTLLDSKSLQLADVYTLSPRFKKSEEKEQRINAHAVGAIAREIFSKSPKRITGKLGIHKSEYSLEIIGCSEVPIEKMNAIYADGAEEE